MILGLFSSENSLFDSTIQDYSLFDKHLISFDKNGNILINKSLDEFDRVTFNVHEDMSISMNENMKKYMSYHKSIFDENNN